MIVSEKARRFTHGRRLLATMLLISMLVIAAPSGVWAQADSPDAAFGETIDVHLVQIPILAHDRHQRPVAGLRPEDLVVKHAGQPMTVAFLTPFAGGPSAQPLPDVRLALDLPGGDTETEAPEPRGEPRNILFFIDVENDQPLGKFHAAHDLIRFVETELDPAYRMAVVSYGGSLRLDQTFTHDRHLVTRAIRRAFDHPRRPNVDLQRRLGDLLRDLEDCAETNVRFDPAAISRPADAGCVENVARTYADEVRPRAADFVRALDGLVRFAGGLDGRKSIVAVSHGLAINPATEVVEAARALFGPTPALSSVFLDLMSGEGVRRALDAVLDQALRSEVTLHFIDRTDAPTGDYGARQAGPRMPGARPMLAAYHAAQNDLQEIAHTTGGLFVASPDLFAGVRDAVAVEQGGYVLGYYTPARLSRQALSKVSIDSRSKGVRIRHRRGSYAQPQQRSTAEGGDLRGTIAVGRPEPVPTSSTRQVRLPLRLEADPRDLGYALDDTQASAQLTLHVRVETHAGRRVADAYHFVHHAYPEALWRAGDEAALVVDGWVEMPYGDYRLVARVQNARTGEGGELVRRLTVAARQAGSSTFPSLRPCAGSCPPSTDPVAPDRVRTGQ